MKIIDSNQSQCNFKYIKEGECFEYNGHFYMKTKHLKHENANIVSLSNGIFDLFEDSDEKNCLVTKLPNCSFNTGK